MKKQNGFVLIETLIVVLLLTVTLMSLYTTFSNIMVKTRAKNNNDTIDTIYKTYFVKDLLDNLYYNSDTTVNYVDSFAYYASKYNKKISGTDINICNAYSYNVSESGAVMTSSGNVIEVCDFSPFRDSDDYKSDPLYDVVSTYNIDKIYYLNFSKIGELSDTELRTLYNKSTFDASSIDYFKNQGKKLDGTFIVIKYLKDYYSPYDFATYTDDTFKIEKDAYHSKISLSTVKKGEVAQPVIFYSDADKNEHYYLEDIPDGTEYVLPSNLGWTSHAGSVIVGWVNKTELLADGEYDKCMSGSSSIADAKCYKANTSATISTDNINRELYAVWCGDGTLGKAMECQVTSSNGVDGIVKDESNYIYKGTGGNQNYVAIGGYCFNMMSNFDSSTGVKAIYYGKYNADMNECGEKLAYSTQAYSVDNNTFNGQAYMYKDVWNLYRIGVGDLNYFASVLGLQFTEYSPILTGDVVPYNNYVYYGDKVSYNDTTHEYTLLNASGKETTNRVLFFSNRQSTFEDFNTYKYKYFCKGGQETKCSQVYYLQTIDASHKNSEGILEPQFTFFYYKDGNTRNNIGNKQIALSSSFTYSGGKYKLNTDDMLYVKVNDFVNKKVNITSLNNHRYGCLDLNKRADGDAYYCDYKGYEGVHYLINYTIRQGVAVTFAKGLTSVNDLREYVNGPIDQTTFGESDVRKTDSNAKKVVDQFFENVFVGKQQNGVNLTDYLDYSVTFCNNMEPNVGFLNANYNVNGVEFYIRYKTDGSNSASNGAYAYRICDGGKKYLYSTSTSNGNGLLKYPIGLITRQEARYTGYKDSVSAGSHYLLNRGFTMTPSVDYPAINAANNYMPLSRIYVLNNAGTTYSADTSGKISKGINPVVSFKMSNKIISGTGAIDNPFVFGGA